MSDALGTTVRYVGGVCVVLAYITYFWRIFKTNPGNRLLECGSMTLIVFLAMIPFSQLGKLPDWLTVAWMVLLLLLCLSTLYFLAQRTCHALREHRKHR